MIGGLNSVGHTHYSVGHTHYSEGHTHYSEGHTHYSEGHTHYPKGIPITTIRSASWRLSILFGRLSQADN